MTIEEKAKAYDEAIKIAKETYNTQPMYRNWLESMFPELQENEIKDMREKLIKAFGSIGKKEWGGVNVKDVIHWLEKQGMSYTKRDVDDAYLEGVRDTKNEIEKQYEANYQIRKDIATFIFNYRGDIKDRAKWMDYLGFKVSFVGEQDEQKPTNTVEPKFHEGDFIKHNKANIICKVLSVNVGFYRLINILGGDEMELSNVEKNFHLWTIQDAKDGDVLAFKNDICGIIICKSPTDYDIGSYCRLVNDNLINEEEIGWNSTLLVPATKEQRDQLEKAMADAGYTFDFEKKELKKKGE